MVPGASPWSSAAMLGVLLILAAGFAVAERRRKSKLARNAAWNFDNVTFEEAYDSFMAAAARRPRGVWLFIGGGYHVRLWNSYGALVLEIAPSIHTTGVTWPPAPGPARVRIFEVSTKRAVEWACDVTVQQDGTYGLPYDLDNAQPIRALNTRAWEIDAEGLARWAKRLGMDAKDSLDRTKGRRG